MYESSSGDYYFIDGAKNWTDANTYCGTYYNSKLAEIYTYEQFQDIHNGFPDVYESRWIGLNKISSSDWIWNYNNSNILNGFTAWRVFAREPNGDGSCVHIGLAISWN